MNDQQNILQQLQQSEQSEQSNKPKLLVTGGTGMVGTAINSVLDHTKYETLFLSSKQCDLTNYQETLSFFQKFKPDYVIHLAANVGGLYKNMNEGVQLYEQNMDINQNVIKAAYATNVKKLVATLSTCIFPDKTTYPIDETMLHDGPPHYSNAGYAYAKRMLEVQTRIYNEQYDTNYVCVIPTNIYGENDNYNLQNAHVIPALIHKCYLAKKVGTPFIVKGTGKPLRQFVYSKDLARLMIWTLEEYDDKSPLILAPTKEYTIREVAEQIATVFKYKDLLKFDPSYSDGQYKKTASNKRLLSICPFVHWTNFESGIKSSVDWFINNFDEARK